MDFNQPPLVSVMPNGKTLPPGEWPRTIPAVEQILSRGITFSSGVTFLVGENGSGKSTIIEALAIGYGLSPEGGTAYGRHSTRPTESPLHTALWTTRGIGAGRWGFFLRAETMHGWYTYKESLGSRDSRYHEMSHGESFIEVLRNNFDSAGLYCLDEPEAALSFTGVLALMGTLHDVALMGGQVICATHSPILTALPGAKILEIGDWGIRETQWQDLAIVDYHRSFLQDPDLYLHHVIQSQAQKD
jgi:predicted ATPase